MDEAHLPPPADHLESILNALDKKGALPPEYISLVEWFSFHEAVHLPSLAADHDDIISVAILDETEFEKFDGFRILGFTAEHGPIYQPLISSLLYADHYIWLGMESDGQTPRYATVDVNLHQTPRELEAMVKLTLTEVKQKLEYASQLSDAFDRQHPHKS